ncbi:unnamed protein product [Fraxinus pennsylvanica]|uniref:Uncharacterized protein n=1 Tax=Fraxinus pennsylvanica TaxID=56036 RepID=A0AAD1YUV2_9LAMI|nr:unnamed protein product [Fraxinus pennsylvanica]
MFSLEARNSGGVAWAMAYPKFCSSDLQFLSPPKLTSPILRKRAFRIFDTRMMASILGSLGAEIEFSNNEMVVNTKLVGFVEPELSGIGKIRGGFFVIGPLLGRFGEAVVGLPSGCDIGA